MLALGKANVAAGVVGGLLLARCWRGPRTAEVQPALAVVLLVCATTVLLGFPAAVAAGASLRKLMEVVPVLYAQVQRNIALHLS